MPEYIVKITRRGLNYYYEFINKAAAERKCRKHLSSASRVVLMDKDYKRLEVYI